MRSPIFWCLCMIGLLFAFGACEEGTDDPAPTTPGNVVGGDPVPVLWGEPVEAENDHQYCLKISKASGGDCTDCMCGSCYDAMVECYFDEGCTYIRECIFVTGCSRASCLTVCGDVFAVYGGNEASWTMMDTLVACAASNCEACAGGKVEDWDGEEHDWEATE